MALAKEGEDWFLDSRFGEVSKYVRLAQPSETRLMDLTASIKEDAEWLAYLEARNLSTNRPVDYNE